MIGISVQNDKALAAALRNMSDDVRDKSGQAVLATATEIKGDIQKRYQRGPKTGHVYYRIPGQKYMTVRMGSADGPPVAFIPGGGSHNLSPVHQASAPDEAPATDTGTLVRSVVVDQVGPLTADVFTLVKYGFYLEYGTRKILPRPAWRPAAMAGEKVLANRLRSAIAGAVK